MSSSGPARGHTPTVGDVRLEELAYRVSVHGRRIPLAPRELEVLRMLMRNAGRTIEFRVLFRAVWGDEDPGDYATLKTHILRLRRKIEDDPHDPRYIRTVRGVGYVFDRNPTTGTHRGKADATGAPNSLPG